MEFISCVINNINYKNNNSYDSFYIFTKNNKYMICIIDFYGDKYHRPEHEFQINVFDTNNWKIIHDSILLNDKGQEPIGYIKSINCSNDNDNLIIMCGHYDGYDDITFLLTIDITNEPKNWNCIEMYNIYFICKSCLLFNNDNKLLFDISNDTINQFNGDIFMTDSNHSNKLFLNFKLIPRNSNILTLSNDDLFLYYSYHDLKTKISFLCKLSFLEKQNTIIFKCKNILHIPYYTPYHVYPKQNIVIEHTQYSITIYRLIEKNILLQFNKNLKKNNLYKFCINTKSDILCICDINYDDKKSIITIYNLNNHIKNKQKIVLYNTIITHCMFKPNSNILLLEKNNHKINIYNYQNSLLKICNEYYINNKFDQIN